MAKLHLIVVSFNTRKLTMKTLSCLMKNTSIPYRITVIDNASQDESIHALEKWEQKDSRFTLIQNQKNLGFARAVNQGLRLNQKREYACLINSDLLVPPNWAPRLLQHFQDTDRVGLVGPLGRGIGGFQDYTHYDGENLISNQKLHLPSFYTLAQKHYQKKKGCFQTAKYLIGCCLIIAPNTLQEVGYLDETYFGGADDLDYSIRARLMGYDLVVAHDVFVWHHVQASFSLLPPTVLQQIREESWHHFNQKWQHVFPPNSWEKHFVSLEETTHPPFRLIKNLRQEKEK